MTALALRQDLAPRFYYGVSWLGLAIIALVLWRDPDIAKWLVKYPRAMVVPLTAWVSVFMDWGVEHLSSFTRAIAAIMDVPLQLAQALLAKGFVGAGQEVLFPRLSWVGIVGAMAIAGHALGGWRVGLVVFVCIFCVALFGQWESAMLTLASVAICVPVGAVTGLFIGILAYRVKWLDVWVIRPALDLAQTVPAFAYLVPVLLLFGFGPVPAMIATVIFATPPIARATKLALEKVPEELTSFADMTGCTRRQKLWRVMIPTAKPLLLVGLNQVTMMTLNMVIIASMIGAGGLGYDVLLALRALKIGAGLEAGFAIVFLAIALDRMSKAAAARGERALPPAEAPWLRRHPSVVLMFLWLVVTTLLGLFIPAFATVPSAMTITTGSFWNDVVGWINVHFFDAIEAFRTWLVINLLKPFKGLLIDLPWIVIVAAAGLLGHQLAGWRLALLALLLMLFPAVTGQWENTMITVYLCSISAFFAGLIGIAIGTWASQSERANPIITVIVDTLQTLPSFVYIIPVVMLFRVGDVTAMIAIVLFAVAPVIRYVNHGIRQVPPHLIEAAVAIGCTSRQIFWRVKLPLAMPEIMLGINQTVLMALSMVVITALVGTSDLGQEVFISLAKADGGRGIVAGLCVAFLGITADRLIVAGAGRLRRRLGLPEE